MKKIFLCLLACTVLFPKLSHTSFLEKEQREAERSRVIESSLHTLNIFYKVDEQCPESRFKVRKNRVKETLVGALLNLWKLHYTNTEFPNYHHWLFEARKVIEGHDNEDLTSKVDKAFLADTHLKSLETLCYTWRDTMTSEEKSDYIKDYVNHLLELYTLRHQDLTHIPSSWIVHAANFIKETDKIEFVSDDIKNKIYEASIKELTSLKK